MKVVINKCYGGFSVSLAALKRLRELGCPNAINETAPGETWSGGGGVRRDDNSFCRDIPRNDRDLVKVVEELGDAANGGCASLSVVEIPDGVDWEIDEYDGVEHIAEKHRTWY